MASTIPTCYQVFQPCSLNTSLFTNFATKSNNDNNINIRPSKLTGLRTLSFSSINPSDEQVSIKKTTNDLNFKDKTTRFRVKGLVNRIKALSSSNRKTEMLQNLEKDAEFQTISDFNHLLMALVIAQEPDVCLRIFKKLPSFQLVPDCCTYSIMIRCYCEKNDMDEAKRALDTILEKGFLPNDATITVLINSLCKRGRVKKALEVFELMGTMGCKPSVKAQNCLMKGLCYVGKVEEALEMLMGMKETLLEPDVYSYNAVMDGLCKVGRSDEAMELLNEAVGMGLIPNVVTFNTLIQGYSREGRSMEGVAVLNLMKKHECVPDCITYNTVLHGLLKWNEVLAALWIYKEMVRLGFEVEVRMMGTLVRRLCKRSWKERGLLQDAVEVFEKMKERDSVVDHRTLEVMVQALCVGKKFEEALANLNYMVRLGYSPEPITFAEVIQGLCATGRVDEAVSTLLLLSANGGIPNRIYYDVLIKELNAQGRLSCASKMFGAALKQGLLPRREPLLCKCYEEGGTVS
ncbi:pentatricopeptide repeat-containing protein At5g64320, mitochondrial-like [Gastrolobium bilobum]|uniref:pentatricopeptide repeat-containing protein At5g64320, mitochondrial-like n=1 Tax=Gastrolobium bilobum TaxID=150636 RepID=UPI002AB0E159|nr:pentatricopeptide repeat-containing protein At5g64320, mitochondrial-like [Gastrolobium bilobum]